MALFARNNLARIHSDCYTRPACAIFPRDAVQNANGRGAEDGTYMFLALWEFEVKPGCEERFQTVYG
ncbi:MAG: hypothetical protein ABLT11_06390, partial [Candidatus Acidiferrum sp.]